MFLLKRSGGMSQNDIVLMHHFIQSTAPPIKMDWSKSSKVVS